MCALRSRNIIAGRTCAADECEVQRWYREMFVMLCVILLFFLPDISMELWKLEELLAADCLVDAQQRASWPVNQRWMKMADCCSDVLAQVGLDAPRENLLFHQIMFIFIWICLYALLSLYAFEVSPRVSPFGWLDSYVLNDGMMGLTVLGAEFKCVKVQSGLKWKIIWGAFDNMWGKYIIWTPTVIFRNQLIIVPVV